MRISPIVSLIALFLLVAPAVVTADSPSDEAQQMVVEARAATAKYSNVDRATNAGYEQITDCIPGQGYHFFNADLLDEEVDHRQPELLLYMPVGQGGTMKLVGVEYATPDTVDPVPTLFGHGFHQAPPGIPWFVLHAWVRAESPNPNGTFADQNPNVVCP